MTGYAGISWNESIGMGCQMMEMDIDAISGNVQQVLPPTVSLRKLISQNDSVPAQIVKDNLDRGQSPHEALVNMMIPEKGKQHNFLMEIPIVIQRGAFLQLVRDNVGDIASALSFTLGNKPDALNDIWHVLGGDISELKSAIIDGARKNISMSIGLSPESVSPEEWTQYCKAITSNAGPFKSQTLFVECVKLKGIDIKIESKPFLTELGHGFAKIILPAAAAVVSVVPGAGTAVAGVLLVAAKGLNELTKKEYEHPPGYYTDINSLKPGDFDQTGVNIPHDSQQLLNEKGFSSQREGDPSQYPSGNRFDMQPSANSFFSPVGFAFKSLLLIPLYNFNPTVENLLGSIAISAPLIYYGYKKLFPHG